MSDAKPLTRDFYVHIAWGIILSIVTCGLYNIYWNAKQFQAMNALLGRYEYKFWLWFILTICTCGIFHVYYEYKMGSDLQNYLSSRGLSVSQNLAIIGLILAGLGLTVVSDAIYQVELNRLMP